MSRPRRSAVRRTARNSWRRRERATGHPVVILSGNDEAHTAAMGVAHSFYRPHGVVGDLGGGSVDLSVVTPDGPGAPYGSLPIGTLPVTRMLLDRDVPAASVIDERLAGVSWLRGAAAGRSFYVVGGGWRALGRVRLAMTDTPLKVVHDYRLTAEEAITLGRSIAALDDDELQTVPGMPGRRIETVRAAALLLERVVRRLEPDQVVFSAFGLREGRAFVRLSAAELAEDPLLAGADDFGRTRSRLPEIGAAMGAGPPRSCPKRRQSSGGCGSPCARCRTAPGASTPRFALARRSTVWHSTHSSASTTPSGRSWPMRCSSATRAIPTTCSSARS